MNNTSTITLSGLVQEAKADYNVYEIVNMNDKSKNYKKKIYIVSNNPDQDDILPMVRSMAKSKTARGGIKAVADNVKASGGNYKEAFTVRKVAGNVSKDRANQIKSDYIGKAGEAKVYNELDPINEEVMWKSYLDSF